MITQPLIVDVQGFKDFNNKFIPKEIVVFDGVKFHWFLIRPPYPFEHLSADEKKHVKWIERNHGILWSEGILDYYSFRMEIISILCNKNIMVKGLEKVSWLKELCPNCNVIDLEEKGCPNLVDLCKLYNDDETDLSCIFHNKKCALKNVHCLTKWLMANNYS